MQPEGRRPMTAREFLSGHKRRAGDALCPVMIAPARLAAYDVLRAVSSGRCRPAGRARPRPHAARTTNAIARSPARSPPATLRWQGAFDHVSSRLSRTRPIAKLDPEVLDILRLSAFQLLHLDRVPASAAVNDAVNLVEQGRQDERVAASSTRCCARYQPRARDAAAAAGARIRPDDREPRSTICPSRCRIPRWLVGALARRYGFDATEALGALRQQPGAADAPRQHAATRASRSSQQRLRQHDVATRPARSRRTALSSTERQPAADAARRRRSVRRPGRSVAARRAARRRRSRASASSTPAPRPAARRRRWRRRWRTAG